MNPDTLQVLARAVALPVAAAAAPDWFMYMPAHDHEITATVGDSAATIKVKVSAKHAEILQADLVRRMNDGGPPPFFGFDHIDGRASAWPQEFAWRANGIWARATWTPDGEAAVTVKAAGQLPSYRYFSPGFRIDKKTGDIIGLCDGECGSLVNNPAFRAIARVAAKNVSAIPADSNQTKTDMKKDPIAESVIKAGLITTEEAAGDSVGTLITQRIAAFQSVASVKASQNTELVNVKAQNVTLQAEMKTMREARADEVIKAAGGRIAPKDEANITFWREAIIEKGESAVKALMALPDKLPKESSATNPGGKPSETEDAGESAEVKARAAQVGAKASELSRSTGKPFGQCWAEADKAIPPIAA